MRIHIKLLLISLSLVSALILATGVVFYSYNARAYYATTRQELSTVAEKMSLQLESRFQQIDEALLFILSDPDFLSAVSIYTQYGGEGAENALLRSDSVATIHRLFRSYAVSKYFTRVVLFDERGNYFSSEYRLPAPDAKTVRAIASALPWREEAAARRGRLLLLSPYANPWDGGGERVYGAVRALDTPSGGVCYLEVQRPVWELTELLSLEGFPGARGRIEDAEGALFFSPDGAAAEAGDWIAADSELNRYGLRATIEKERSAALSGLSDSSLQIVAICLTALIASSLYIYFSVRRLTRPLRRLQEAMDQTVLENLGGRAAPKNTDELRALNEAFEQLCKRLNLAMEAQVRSQNLEIRARLDALQAQVDPHFLFNTLNVIMSRALQTGDEETLTVCEGIADMLRYSTSTERRFATLGEERSHLAAYLTLMKKRYQHKLDYTIDIPKDMEDLILPKMVLQPIAENAFRHGFSRAGGVMRVCVLARECAGTWELRVEDNGAGFDDAVLNPLREKIDAIQSGSYSPGEEGLSLGGMGLVNTCARLYYFFEGNCAMRLENASPGARVIIEMPALRKGDGTDDADTLG